jgi:hypothetical protein
MSTVKIPPQSEKSGTNARISRQNWLQLSVNFVVFVVIFIGIQWDRHERAQQLDHLKLELKQIETQVKEMERQADKHEIPARAKEPAPATTKPPERRQHDDRLRPASTP